MAVKMEREYLLCMLLLCAVNSEHRATLRIIHTEPHSGRHRTVRPWSRHGHVSNRSVVRGSHRLCCHGYGPGRPARGQLGHTAEYHLAVCLPNHRRAKAAVRCSNLCSRFRRWEKHFSWCKCLFIVVVVWSVCFSVVIMTKTGYATDL